MSFGQYFYSAHHGFGDVHDQALQVLVRGLSSWNGRSIGRKAPRRACRGRLARAFSLLEECIHC
jgi:hypothetical protein